VVYEANVHGWLWQGEAVQEERGQGIGKEAETEGDMGEVETREIANIGEWKAGADASCRGLLKGLI
jgi:hypothetical protein